jgi:hypothetical protein
VAIDISVESRSYDFALFLALALALTLATGLAAALSIGTAIIGVAGAAAEAGAAGTGADGTVPGGLKAANGIPRNVIGAVDWAPPAGAPALNFGTATKPKVRLRSVDNVVWSALLGLVMSSGVLGFEGSGGRKDMKWNISFIFLAG